MMRFVPFVLVFLTHLLNAAPWVKRHSSMPKGGGTLDTAVITPWTSFKLAITSTGTNPTKATTPSQDSAHWRRVGDTMEINYVYYSASSAGAADGTGLYLFSIPPGYTIDTTKVSPSTDLSIHSIVGSAAMLQHFNGYMWVYDPTHLAMMGSSGAFTYFPVGAGGTPYILQISNFGNYQFNAKVPISGWSARRLLSKGKVAPHSMSRDTVTITNFTAYNPSISTDRGFTLPTWDTSVGTNASYWRRVGDSMDIIFSMYHPKVGSPTSGSANYYFSLPSGYSVDATKMPLEGGTPSAHVSAITGPGAVHACFNCYVFPYDYVGFWLQCGGATVGTGSSFEAMDTAPVSYRFMATVPILGWGT